MAITRSFRRTSPFRRGGTGRGRPTEWTRNHSQIGELAPAAVASVVFLDAPRIKGYTSPTHMRTIGSLTL